MPGPPGMLGGHGGDLRGRHRPEPACTRSHYWETFAIAILPADARTFDQPTLEKNPTVNAVCSMRVVLASRAAVPCGFQ